MNLNNQIVSELRKQSVNLSDKQIIEFAEEITQHLEHQSDLASLPEEVITREIVQLFPSIQIMVAENGSSIKDVAQHVFQIVVHQVIDDPRFTIPETYCSKDYCPYPGLSPFSEEENSYFFGRDDDVKKFLTHIDRPIIVLTGPSGVGKSSFVAAGVFPRLAKNFKNSSINLIYRIQSNTNLLSDFAEFLSTKTGEPAESVIQKLKQEDGSLFTLLQSSLGKINQRVFLFLDQFEALFVGEERNRKDDRICFLNNLLLTETQQQTNFLTIIVASRENYFEHPAYTGQTRLIELVQSENFPLFSLTDLQLRQAIVQPLNSFNANNHLNLVYQEGLADLIINDFHIKESSLPLVQYILRLLWTEKNRLTHFAYNQLGGLERVLDSHAWTIYRGFSDEEQNHVKGILVALVRPGISGEYTRKRIRKENLLLNKEPATQKKIERIIDRLSDTNSRIISEQEIDRSIYIELTHEIILRHWIFLQQLIEEHKERIEIRELLLPKAEIWLANRDQNSELGDTGELFVGNELDRARLYVETASNQESLDASIVECYEASRRYQKRRILLNSILLFLLFVGLFSIIIFFQSRTNREGIRADQAEAQVNLEFTRNAMTQGTATQQRFNSVATEAALETQQSINQSTLSARTTAQSFAEETRDAQATSAAQAVATRDLEEIRRTEAEEAQAKEEELNESLELVAEANRLLQVPDGDHELAVLLGLFALSKASSVEGQDMLSNGLFRLRTLMQLNPPSGEDNLPNDRTKSIVELSPNKQFIIYQTGTDNSLRIHEAKTGRFLWRFVGHTDNINSIAFTKDSNQMLSAGEDGRIILWNLEEGGSPRILYVSDSALTSVDLNQEEDQLLVGYKDGQLNLLSFPDSSLVFSTSRFEDEIVDAKFTPDGEHILIALGSNPPRVVLRSLSTENNIYARSITWPIFSITFSPDGTEFVTSVLGRNIEIRSIDDGDVRLEIPLSGVVNIARFSPDGKQIVTASSALMTNEGNNDGRSSTLKFWNLDNGGLEQTFSGHNSTYIGMAFLGNERLVIQSIDDSVRILSNQPLLNETGSIPLLAPHTYGAWNFDVSNDGELLLTTGTLYGVTRDFLGSTSNEEDTSNSIADAQVWIIDATTGALVTELTITNTILSGRFSPDDSTVLLLTEKIESKERLALIWNWKAGDIISSYPAYAESPAGWFFPNSDSLLRHHADSSVSIVSLFENSDHFVLKADDEILQAALVMPSLDAELILTVSEDNRLQIWDIYSGTLLSTRDTILEDSVLEIEFSDDGQFALLRQVSKVSIISLPALEIVYEFEEKRNSDVIGFDALGVYKIRIINKLFSSNIEIETWSSATGFSNIRIIESDDIVESVIRTPDGRRIITTSGATNNIITAYDAITGESLYSFNHSGAGSRLSLSPDGNLFTLSSIRFNSARTFVWNSHNGELLRTFDLAGSGLFNIIFAFFTKTGNSLVTLNLPLATASQFEIVNSGGELAEGDFRTVSEFWYLNYQELACKFVFRELTSVEKTHYDIGSEESICK